MNKKLENIRIKYQLCINLFIAESSNQWNRYGALLVVNTIYLSVINGPQANHPEQTLLTRTSGGLIGLTICILWLISTYLGFKYKNKWMKYARLLEEQLPGGINPISAGVPTPFRLIKVENIAYSIILIFALLYIKLLFS